MDRCHDRAAWARGAFRARTRRQVTAPACGWFGFVFEGTWSPLRAGDHSAIWRQVLVPSKENQSSPGDEGSIPRSHRFQPNPTGIRRRISRMHLVMVSFCSTVTGSRQRNFGQPQAKTRAGIRPSASATWVAITIWQDRGILIAASISVLEIPFERAGDSEDSGSSQDEEPCRWQRSWKKRIKTLAVANVLEREIRIAADRVEISGDGKKVVSGAEEPGHGLIRPGQGQVLAGAKEPSDSYPSHHLQRRWPVVDRPMPLAGPPASS